VNGLLEPLSGLNSFDGLVRALSKNRTPVLATGVMDSQKTHLTAGLSGSLAAPVLFVTASELKAREIYNDLRFFYRYRVLLFPSKDIVFYGADVRGVEILKKRFETLNALIRGERPAVCCSVEALFDRLSPFEVFKDSIINIEAGDNISIASLAEKLIDTGYERTDAVEGAGQFAIRGGIMDVCTAVNEMAYRAEFWGDTVDSIRVMDLKTQRSVEKKDRMTLFPMRELVCGESVYRRGIEKIEKEFNKTIEKYISAGEFELADRLRESAGELVSGGGVHARGLDAYFKYFYDDETTLLDYLDDDSVIIFDEPARVAEHAENVFAEFNESVKNRILAGYLLPGQIDMVVPYARILTLASRFRQVLFSTVMRSVRDFSPRETVHFSIKSSGVVKNQIQLLLDDLRYLVKNNYRAVILAGARTRCENLAGEISGAGISCVYRETLDEAPLEPGVVTVSKGSLNKGFEYQDIRLIVITDREIFGEEKRNRKARAKNRRIDSFLDLKVGDYVVHDSHGIGVYRGIEKIVTDGANRDYMKVSYADGGSLFIPLNQMDAVQKYIGGEGVKPKLNRLTGGEWQKAKSRTRAQVKIQAAELIELYAMRQGQNGFAYSPDTVWQTEFEETFPFEETEDQLISIAEVKADMEDSKVMDRLLCGDVGYGKTEVAIRAAFKAVQDGKQVAYLVPTTILAQQHYNTFTQRMKDFPIEIEMLSRFRTPAQQKASVDNLRGGRSDIVIGTHRILSKDIAFKNLGLVVIDEEQRFGVAHKEKLKHLRASVDVLTLTATPIPRTLHMSLTGIRDMSVLEEPPLERQPVQTYVMENNPEFIRDAINRELSRGGQVYYLHNRVVNIEEAARRVRNLVPDASVAYAHGQMPERELERIMKDFIDGEIQVLVCTTIIETGLDIGNVNTIVIEDADKMGLSQLYQLRGRVGRTNRIAYAYLLFRKDKVLDEVAEKRLQAIREFTAFGSGIKIAMRDLEIRGAGNILGAEQHGHMDAVGYDLYCRLLADAVSELRGEAPKKDFSTSIDIKINAYIPDFYIGDEETKLNIYKKISVIGNEKDLSDCRDELSDRFGEMPASVRNLLDVALLKASAHDAMIESVVEKPGAFIFMFAKQTDLSGAKIPELIKNNRGKVYYSQVPSPYLTYRPDPGESVTPHSLNSFVCGLA